jgi:hypothetical protein
MIEGFKLYQNYPNPFSAGGAVPAGRQGSTYGGNPATTIKYSIPVGSKQNTDDGSQNSENRLKNQSFNQPIYPVEDKRSRIIQSRIGFSTI